VYCMRTPSAWVSGANCFILAASLLAPIVRVSAQQTVSIEVPGATKPIQGDLYGNGSSGLILTHGGGRTKESWRKQAMAFTDAGFIVLAIDFRSDTIDKLGRPISVGSDEDNAADIRTAASYLRTHGVKNVSAVGASMGGYALAEADAKSDPGEFERIVLLASSAGDGAALKGRKLFVVARDDVGSSGHRFSEISDSYTKAPQPKELLVLEGSAHAQSLFDTDQGPRLMKEILRFLTEP
jgi:pimeloyl-ACP methyl ester carboxylesterase